MCPPKTLRPYRLGTPAGALAGLVSFAAPALCGIGQTCKPNYNASDTSAV